MPLSPLRAPEVQFANPLSLANDDETRVANEDEPRVGDANQPGVENASAGLGNASESGLGNANKPGAGNQEERWRENAGLTIHINHYLEPIKVKATIANDGISLNLLLANAVPDTVKPTFNDLAKLCKQIASESNDFTGRRVHEFVGVRWYSIVAYSLGKPGEVLHHHRCQFRRSRLPSACLAFLRVLENKSNL